MNRPTRLRFASILGLLVFVCGVELPAQFLPPDMVRLTVTKLTEPSPGFLYMAPHSRVVPRPFGSYLMVHNRNGGVVGWSSLGDELYPWDFKVVPDGRMAFTEYGLFSVASQNMGVFILDSSFEVREREALRRGYPTTQHDFLLLPNGNRIIVGAEDVTMDLSSVVPRGHPAASIVQAVFQEVEPDGSVVFQWKSLDHIPIEACYDDLTVPSIRYIHNNAIWVDDDDNFLLSMRHIAAILKVNRNTGKVMWVLGGKLNQFEITGDHPEFAPNYFSYQHDIRRAYNGNITMFDNGTQHEPRNSRAVEYKIDEEQKTAQMVWEYRQKEDVYVSNYGSVQTLVDGHRLITWGTAVQGGSVAVTEVDSTGNVVFEATYPRTMYPYRAIKHPMWPPGRPSATVTVNEVLANNTYRFLKGNDTTGVTVTFHDVAGGFYNSTTARRFIYSPVLPRFVDRAPTLFPVRVDFVSTFIQRSRARIEFDVRILGLEHVAHNLVVYRRDSASAIDFMQPLATSYDDARGVLVVDNVALGEFAFGIPQEEVQALAPRLTSPIADAAVSATRPLLLRLSPQGRCRQLGFVIATDKEMKNVVAEIKTVSDSWLLDVPLLPGRYYWQGYATTAKPDAQNATFTNSGIDSFRVVTDFIAIINPMLDTVWVYDELYPIRWQTTKDGLVRLELRRDGQTYLIADSVRAALQGFQWRVRANVPRGSGYTVHITTIADHVPIEATSASRITISDGFTSITHDATQQGITIAPNPASSHVLIGGYESLAEVRLFTVDGDCVLNVPMVGTGGTLNVSSLPRGMYVVSAIKTDGTRHTSKIVLR